MSTFEDQFGKTFYLKKGRASKRQLPIIGLHGGPGGTHLNIYALTWLQDQRNVILYDQIGSGLSSEIPLKQANIPNFVRNLDNLTQHLELDQFHLFGTSWGTTLALEYFLKYKKQKKVASLILQSPMFDTSIWKKDASKLIKKLPLRHQKAIHHCCEVGAYDSRVYREAVKYYYSKHVYRLKSRPDWVPTPVPNAHGDSIYKYMWGPSEFISNGTLKKYSCLKELSKVNIPSLIICGQHDESTPSSGYLFSKKIRGEFKEIKGGSHSLLIEKPEETLKVIRKFLNQVDQTKDML